MYALITHHDAGYKALADLTWDNNKVLYAKKHGYGYHAKTENWTSVSPTSPGIMTGFEKLYIAKEILTEHPEYKWLWWTGTDSMITNFSTRIEDRVNNAYHFMICMDINGVNADSLLIRNSPEAFSFIDDVLAEQEYALKFWDGEQRAINKVLGWPGTSEPGFPPPDKLIESIPEKYKNIVQILPQRYMNSFNYCLYPQYTVPRDKLDWDGNWQLGDWLIHWPACHNDYRIQLFNFYNEYIIR